MLVNFAQQHDVLATNDIQTEWGISKLVPNDDPLHSSFEHQVRKLVERAQDADDLSTVPQLHQQALVQLLYQSRACTPSVKASLGPVS